ncbi:uncharacterized protein LOC131246464 isoform X2 [Magnolia sinica]|uniref:uncharacterized protein LOC131246464 isoform X2 n=1 Tax=Magnolia sinica TaxID=86752 RepID=UPI00265A84B0|nr:uncharacterized protein LOC131246464 isoform X2 [Magnolia sinica]
MAKALGKPLTFFFLILLWETTAAAAIVASDGDNKNFSVGRLFWATAKDGSDLLVKAEGEDSTSAAAAATASADEHDEFEGGFSSLDGMLQWAIGHSDPRKLKEKAHDVQRLSANELEKRQLEIKELMEKLKMPSDPELMQIAIADLSNSSISLADRHRALHELLILVEPIDNANGMNASQILELGALSKLMKMVKSSFTEEAIKALYAVSAVIRNNFDGQELFYAEAGHVMLQEIMSNSRTDVRLRRKCIFLVADLVECQLQSTKKAEVPFFSNHLFLKSVVDLTASTDLDLQEKTLMAIRSLLQLTTTEALVFKNFCDLGGALERMRKQLEELMAEEFQREYARDLESLRREVEFIFHRKLEKATLVPT